MTQMTKHELAVYRACMARYALYLKDNYSWDPDVRKASDKLIAACAAAARAERKRCSTQRRIDAAMKGQP